MIINNLDKKITAKDIAERNDSSIRTAQTRMAKVRAKLNKVPFSDITWREYNEVFGIVR